MDYVSDQAELVVYYYGCVFWRYSFCMLLLYIRTDLNKMKVSMSNVCNIVYYPILWLSRLKSKRSKDFLEQCFEGHLWGRLGSFQPHAEYNLWARSYETIVAV